jgi:hypothetical protein
MDVEIVEEVSTEVATTNEIHAIIADFSQEIEVTPEILSSRRDRILELEKAMSQVSGSYDMDQFNPGKIRHHFGTGVYGRELFIPKGNVIVSKIHKGKTLNVIAKGVIAVIDPETGYKILEAPHVFVSSPLTKRVVIAIEDTLWITSHENKEDSEDLEEIENRIIAKNFNDKLLSHGEEKCLG